MSDQHNSFFQSAAENDKWLKQSIDEALPTKRVIKIQKKFIFDKLINNDQFHEEDILEDQTNVYANMGDKHICINAIAKTVNGIFCVITDTNDARDVKYLDMVGSALLTAPIKELSFRQKELVIVSAYEMDDINPEIVSYDEEITFGIRHRTLIEDGYLIGRYLYQEDQINDPNFPKSQIDSNSSIPVSSNSGKQTNLYYESGAHILSPKLTNIEVYSSDNM